ncbi:MAG: hypothetical protein WBA39_07615 [Rivularia sp. (in: cyanobacteria)]
MRASCSLVTASEQDACPYGHTSLTHYEYVTPHNLCGRILPARLINFDGG